MKLELTPKEIQTMQRIAPIWFARLVSNNDITTLDTVKHIGSDHIRTSLSEGTCCILGEMHEFSDAYAGDDDYSCTACSDYGNGLFIAAGHNNSDAFMQKLKDTIRHMQTHHEDVIDRHPLIASQPR